MNGHVSFYSRVSKEMSIVHVSSSRASLDVLGSAGYLHISHCVIS